MDLPNSAVALAVLAVATAKNKAVIGSGAGSSVLTGAKCSPIFVHWTYDTYELGHAFGRAMTEAGGKTWFFITADYAFGKDLSANCQAAVKAAGGQTLGEARHPLNTSDFSSFLLQAQSSGADVVALANSGGDMDTCIKQAHEFGLTAKQKLAGFVLNVTSMPALGLEIAQGSTVATPFYWDFTDATRAFGRRFQAMHAKKLMPNDMHAGMYASTAHLLKAYAQIKSADDGKALIDAMKATPTDDPLFGKGLIRADGRHIHPVYLMQVKTPSESKGEWDVFKLISTVSPENAFRPLDQGGCPFIKA
jgi:branched-chain amino acid transport system substrate-binding protein